MEQDITLKAFLKEILEPIIDDCITKSMNKFIPPQPEKQADAIVTVDIMNASQAAEYLSFSKTYLYKLTHKRIIPHYKRGKLLYFRKDDLDQWIIKGQIKTQEDIEAIATSYIFKKGRKLI